MIKVCLNIKSEIIKDNKHKIKQMTKALINVLHAAQNWAISAPGYIGIYKY